MYYMDNCLHIYQKSHLAEVVKLVVSLFVVVSAAFVVVDFVAVEIRCQH